jgi:acetylornithine deacetylase/succinyl-diaminopimelate desuccinylase-like protein
VQIPVPQRPLTSIVLSSIHGGVAFGTVASETELEVEIRSESAAELERIRAAVAGIVESVAASSGKRLEWSIAARQHPGALDAGHPLVAQARRVLEALGQPIMVYPTTAQLAVVFEHQLPGVTLGLTRAERRVDMGEVREKLEIAPLWDGMTQLVLNVIGADEMVVA